MAKATLEIQITDSGSAVGGGAPPGARGQDGSATAAPPPPTKHGPDVDQHGRAGRPSPNAGQRGTGPEVTSLGQAARELAGVTGFGGVLRASDLLTRSFTELTSLSRRRFQEDISEDVRRRSLARQDLPTPRQAESTTRMPDAKAPPGQAPPQAKSPTAPTVQVPAQARAKPDQSQTVQVPPQVRPDRPPAIQIPPGAKAKIDARASRSKAAQPATVKRHREAADRAIETVRSSKRASLPVPQGSKATPTARAPKPSPSLPVPPQIKPKPSPSLPVPPQIKPGPAAATSAAAPAAAAEAGEALAGVEAGAGVAAAGLAEMAGPIGIAVAGLAVAGIGAKKFGDAIEEQAKKLSDFSGPLAMQEAINDIRDMQTQMRRAETTGPELADFSNDWNKAMNALSDIGTEMLKSFLDFYELIRPAVQIVIQELQATSAGMAVWGDMLQEFIAWWQEDAKAENDARDRRDKDTKRLLRILAGQDANDTLDDPMTNAFIRGFLGPRALRPGANVDGVDNPFAGMRGPRGGRFGGFAGTGF